MYSVNTETTSSMLSMLTLLQLKASHWVASELRPVQNSCVKEKKSVNVESGVTVPQLQRFVCFKINSLIK
jgi:hypothetical protein